MKLLLTLIMIAFVVFSALAGYWGPDKAPLLFRIMASACISFAGIAIFRQIMMLFLAFINSRQESHFQKRNTNQGLTFLPKISIIVPAYNEETVIERALTSLQNIDYPDYDILVIDDGSSDATLSIATSVSESSSIPINVTSQQNGGKSKALNNGIRISDAEFVFCVDADSHILPNGLKSAIQHFQDPKVCAVAGHVEVSKDQNSYIALLQRLEYQLMQRVTRSALSYLKCIPIVPGPAGLFRKNSVIAIGCYESGDTCFAEDAELSMKLLTTGGRIIADNELVSITQAPNDINTLLRQRYRWFRGSLQALFNNFDTLMGRGSRRSFFLFVFLVLEYLMMPIAGISIGLFFLFNTLSTGAITTLLWGLIGLLALELIGLITVTKINNSYINTIVHFLCFKITYGYLLLFWSFFCLIDEINDQSMSWDKLERFDV